ncbi:MAG TPA: porin [Gammaproteobacteria bacterium]|nr:porin [Gammaproteobacteria bacterium]
MKDQRSASPGFKPVLFLSGLIATGLFSSPVAADNWADRINLTGFMSAKYQKISKDNFFNGDDYTGIGKDGSFRGTMIGLNLTAPIDDRITIFSQFLATQEDDSYVSHLDWGFIAVGLTDEFTIRAGKMKFPIGIVNEYISVGNAYPWINPPMLFYTEEASGANITREAYSGGSALWEYSRGDINMSADIFGGEITLGETQVRNMAGAKIHLDWNEEISFQANYNRGTMHNTPMPVMEGLNHTTVALGMRIDWNNIIGYAEWADTDMETEIMNGNSWYTTLGYQMGDWLPHLTYQYFKRGEESTSPQEQNMTTAGLRYDLSDVADLKFEYSIINTEKGQGLFENAPVDESINRFGIAIDVVF